MAATPPPGYTPPPADLPQRGDRATFSNRVDAWVTWFSTVILTQLAAIVASAYANALEAAASALTAIDARDAGVLARDAAIAARNTAQGYRDTALTARDQAAASATAANDSRVLAQAAATAALSGIVTATSTTSNPIGLGDTTFTTQAGKQFAVNVPVIAVDAANPNNYISGTIKSYSGTTLVVTGARIGGSGTIANWNISVSGVMGVQGVQGLPGGVTGGNLTGALNELRGADITSGPTPDIWGTGNLHRVTSTDTITGFPAAPQAGAERVLWIDSVGTPITASANLIVVGGSTTLRTNDLVFIRALTTTTFVATIERADGTAVVAPPIYVPPRNMRIIQNTGPFVPTVTGWHRITIRGGTGRGGRAVANISRATGPGAPGTCIRWCYLTAGTGYLFNIGSGAPGSATVTGATQGASGNATTFAAPSGTMTANGGGGGAASVTGVVSLAGGPGGTATGGDLNLTGGRGGNITVTGTPGSISAIATGAGAVALYDVGYNGGDATLTATVTAGTTVIGTGGAGVGGDGGSISFTTTVASAAIKIFSAAGGAGGGVGAVTTNNTIQATAGVNALGEVSATTTPLVVAQLTATAGGTPAVDAGGTIAIPAPGGGGGAVLNPSNGFNQPPGGILSGGGAVVNTAVTNGSLNAASARFGASGGGIAVGDTTYVAATTGTGFAGFAIVEWS